MEKSKKEFVWPAIFIFLYAALGEQEKAIEWLEITYDQREAWIDVIQVEGMFDILRNDPRFKALVEKVNFP